MRRKIFALLLAGALCAGLAVCGGQGAQETQEDTAAAADAAAETDAAAYEDAAAGTEEAAAADADAAGTTGSGKVTVYMPSPAGLADKLAAAFTEKTGVQVEQFQGTTGEILARLETEEAKRAKAWEQQEKLSLIYELRECQEFIDSIPSDLLEQLQENYENQLEHGQHFRS